jgi:Ku protein
VDELYLDESYYIVPNDKVAYEAFAVIREAMKKENMVGLARVVLYRRERLLMLQPRGKGLMGTGLRYKSEVRAEDKYFDEIPEVKVRVSRKRARQVRRRFGAPPPHLFGEGAKGIKAQPGAFANNTGD